MQQDESRLNLEAEIDKTSAKEKAYAEMSNPSLLQLQPLKLESRFDDEDSSHVPPGKPGIEKVHPGYHVPRSSTSAFKENPVSDRNLQWETISLHRQQQADLQLQQNRIVEMIVHNQIRSKLPQPRVPVFDGNPMEYCSFICTFDSFIESRTYSSPDRLYYLEQFTPGDVKEIVRSCHHLPSEEGYNEAPWLLKKKFGEEYRIASAYEERALSWSSITHEDGLALKHFSIFLTRVRNALASSKYISKFHHPGNIQKLVLNFPYGLRER